MVATGEHEDDEAALRRVRASPVTRENLRRAIVTVINETLATRDPKWWGKATTTASDSKRFGSWWKKAAYVSIPRPGAAHHSEVAAKIQGLLGLDRLDLAGLSNPFPSVSHVDVHQWFLM